MTIFEFVTVAISIIFGIALSRLLSAGIELFRHRNSVELSWIPIVWAADLFWLLVVLWWQIFQISQVKDEWTFGDFNLTIAIVVALYIASSLILPTRYEERGASLYDHYRREGRWGVAAYVIFFVIAIPWNYAMYGFEILSWGNWDILAMIGASLGAVISKSVRQVGVFTAIFMVLHLTNIASVYVPVFVD